MRESCGRIKTAEPKLTAEVAAWLAAAETADAAEDAEHGAQQRGDETPSWMANKQHRLEGIRAAKSELEAESLTAAMAKKIRKAGRPSR